MLEMCFFYPFGEQRPLHPHQALAIDLLDVTADGGLTDIEVVGMAASWL